MPRKTRKQKERTSRRSLQSSFKSNSREVVKREFSFTELVDEKWQIGSSKEKQSEKSVPLQDESPTTKAITKSLLLAASIIATELVIYSVWFK